MRLQQSPANLLEIRQRLERLKEGSSSSELLAELAARCADLEACQNNINELQQQNYSFKRDISRIEAERNRYRDLFTFAPDGYLLTDSLGTIQEANLAAERMFLLRSGHYADKALIVFVPPEERKTFGELLSEVEMGKDIVERDLWITPPGAAPFPAAVKVAAIRTSDGRLQNLRWLIRDITRSRQAEEALYRAHDALDQRVQERTAELADVNEALQDQIAEHMRVLEALRRSEQELSDFFDNASVGLHCTGPDGIIIKANQEALQSLGYSRDEYVGHHIEEFYERREAAQDILRRLANKETVQQHEARLRCKDGSIKEVLIDANVLWEGDQFVYSRCFTLDISKRKQTQAALRESEERFKQIADNIHEIFWLFDAKTRKVIYVSNAYEEIWGRHCEDLHANPMDWMEAIHPDDRQRVAEQDANRVISGHYDVEYRIVRPDGEIRWVRDKAVPIRDDKGEIYRFAGIAEDITARKQSEEQRAILLQEQAAHRAKDEFLTMVAHELRTPLTAILGWTQLLSRGTLDAATSSRALSIIDRNTQLQAQLIEDLLDASRIATGRLAVDMRSANMHQVIEAALDTVRLSAEHKGITLCASLDPTVGAITGDPDRLQQVVWNLLSNAIKFTPAGGLIEVVLEQTGNEIQFMVKDTGNGISANFLPRLFERFSQENEHQIHGGLGLGLAIVRHIVELHSGTVRASSPGVGRGTTFTVVLPLKPAPETPATSPGLAPLKYSAELTDLTGCEVLLLDDDLESRECLKQVMEHCGAVVRSCGDSREAFETMKLFHPDVILSDVQLRGEDGCEFIKTVRASENNGEQIPAAALTAHTGSEERRRALAAGFQMHLAKPINPAQLVAAVSSLRQLNTEASRK